MADGQVDFYSMLSGLGDTIAKQRQESARKQALSGAIGPDGQVDFQKAILGFAQLGDAEGAARFAQIAGQNQDRQFRQTTDARDFGFRQEESRRAQSNADRGFGFQQTEAQRAQQNADRGYDLQDRTQTRLADRTPPNYEPDPARPGAIRPMVGGPADPAQKAAATQSEFDAAVDQRKKAADAAGLAAGTPEYQQFVVTGTYTRPKPKDLPTSVVKDMNEKGGTLEDFSRLSAGFKEEYGGFKTAFAGDTVNAIARNTGIGNEDRSSWWQDYQNQKNIVRNRLFGSALTATEKNEFDKANIHPGMTPGTIRENLRRQHDAARRAAVKLVNTYSKMGYSQDQIEAATGFPLSDLQAPAARPAPASGNKPATGVVSFTDYFRQ
jgi:hypothetical protein